MLKKAMIFHYGLDKRQYNEPPEPHVNQLSSWFSVIPINSWTKCVTSFDQFSPLGQAIDNTLGMQVLLGYFP